MKTDSRTILELFCGKNSFKKHLIVEIWQLFENRQNWSRCMGYSLFKMLSLSQKFQFLKTCEKLLLKHITVVLCKKNRFKKHLIFEKWQVFENRQNWSQCMGYRRIFVYTFCLINICLSLSDDAHKIKTLNIERA